jgi:hypothetical protein
MLVLGSNNHKWNINGTGYFVIDCIVLSRAKGAQVHDHRIVKLFISFLRTQSRIIVPSCSLPVMQSTREGELKYISRF